MEESIRWKYNENAGTGGGGDPLRLFSPEEIKKVRNFHQSITGYQPTPLRSLANLAKFLGVAGIYIKDESYRFGLNAFKALGATYAMGKYLAGHKSGEITFTTATDGNHGRGVAWAAAKLGHKAVIYMPRGTSPARINNIRATGAEVYLTDHNYDETVRIAAENAKKFNRVIVQDTAWEGYSEIPAWIMQGYCTMADEALEQLAQQGVAKPTHVFLQAGVGSFPGAMQGYLAAKFEADRPVTVIVEPNKADCFFKSAEAGDGRPRKVAGMMDTIMAGLACGEPNPTAWNILRDYSEMFVSCPDYIAANGMRILGNPLGGDHRVISGESGAVTTGILTAIMQDSGLHEIRAQLNLTKDSNILLFSTEGDTDPEKYRRIVWRGAYPSS